MPGFMNQFAGDPSQRHIETFDRLHEITDALRKLGQTIVLTQGTFDLLHVGHVQYLEQAKSHGDILIVGVDSDEKVRERKGLGRPIVPEDERIQMLCYQRAVDFVVVKPLAAPKWELIRLVRPDTMIATAETYSDEELLALQAYCGHIEVLKPMSSTSTSAKIRRAQISLRHVMQEALEEAFRMQSSKVAESVMRKLFEDGDS